jgi:hypothetical protein
VIVRCTAKLLELLDRRRVTLVEAESNDDDWYANLLWLDRRKCLLLMHVGTLFPVFAADVRKGELQPLGPFVVQLIETQLARERLPTNVLGRLDADALHLARTASRSVLGFMNETAFQCRYHVEAAGGLGRIDLDVLNHGLRRTLHNRDGYHDPLELVVQRLEAK